MTPEELKSYITDHFSENVSKCWVDESHAIAEIPLDQIGDFLAAVKDDQELYFDMLMDLTVVDWLERKPRFDVVYHLYSVKHNHRLRLKVGVEDGEAVPTATKLWLIADWLEREMWDLYGIKFSGHPNLKRILLYETFKGHPLRKDYPYDKRQPLVEETWLVRDKQVKMEDLKIHRP